MPRAKRICPEPGCPHPASGRYCPRHNAERDRQRGSKAERGYGSAHVRLRKQWAPRVATGTVLCARCGQPIESGEPWALDHDDNDRTKYLGPSHRHCNDSAGGKAAHRYE